MDRNFSKSTQVFDPMKYLIAGLGNIGAEYENTRHNIGFDVVDFLANQNNASWKLDSQAYIDRDQTQRKNVGIDQTNHVYEPQW